VSAVADKLREARALCEAGWTQDNYADLNDNEETCYCASGAIGLVACNDIDAGDFDIDEQDPAYRSVIAALGAAVGCKHSYEIARWNDAPERTQAEVLAAFDKAIQLAEQGGEQ
jgi:hypothetical protein